MDHRLLHFSKTIKFLGGKNRENPQKLGLGKEFLALTAKAHAMQKKINNLDFIKI